MTDDAAAHANLKARQQATWASGDFSVVATMITIVSERLCETVDLRAGRRVLDVATGSGNTAIAAARRFTTVTGVDFVPALLERGRARAAAEGLSIEFLEGDAEDLPVPDAAFDVVLSTFGVMFAPDQARAGAEMCRVLRPGGYIGMSNWIPDGSVGDLFRTVAKHVPPPPGLDPPTLWGNEEHLHKLFPGAQIALTRRTVRIVMPSMDFWIAYFRRWFGPVLKAFEAVGPDGEAALEADLREFTARNNVSDDDTLVLPQDYVDVVVRPAR